MIIFLLQNFYSDTSRFPPEEVQRFQGEDGEPFDVYALNSMHFALPALSSILLAKEREQKLCLAEYELRVATEDLKQTKVRHRAWTHHTRPPWGSGLLWDVCDIDRGCYLSRDGNGSFLFSETRKRSGG